jgi:hypothetical protein
LIQINVILANKRFGYVRIGLTASKNSGNGRMSAANLDKWANRRGLGLFLITIIIVAVVGNWLINTQPILESDHSDAQPALGTEQSDKPHSGAQSYKDANAAVVCGDFATAIRILRPLAAEGDATAQGLLGDAYIEGWGAPKDYAEAVKWFRRAADQGNAFSEGFLGALYRDGEGVPQDYVRAYMWFTLQAQTNETAGEPGGQTPAQRAYLNRIVRDALAAQMTPAQIAEARKLASEWKPQPERPH